MNFLFTAGFVQIRQIHSKSDNSEIINEFGTDEITEKRFELLVQRYQLDLKQLVKDSNFVFENIHELHYNCYKGLHRILRRLP